MPTIEVMNQVVAELTTEFSELAEDKDIYLSPVVIETPSRRLCVLQVCDGGQPTAILRGVSNANTSDSLSGYLKASRAITPVDTSAIYPI